MDPAHSDLGSDGVEDVIATKNRSAADLSLGYNVSTLKNLNESRLY